ncbi:MAG: succinyldiaminopimelate transaminase [Sinobacteraceae bacterium]|nr:succinyldiaminopimelate transaminase [Nevskiaceae bacterium]
MNPRLARLHAYPFERLAALKAGVLPPAGLTPIGMSIGEPQHEPSGLVLQALRENLHRLGSYPTTAGLPELRAAAAQFLERRFGLRGVDPETMVLPVNGTREGLFSFVQAAVDGQSEPLVAMPNPFYQIYEGAALLAGAEPLYLPSLPNHMPDLESVPPSLWDRCQVLFLCTPGNPSGAILPLQYLQHALQLANQHDFVIASDECYSDIYLDEHAPPPGLLQAARASGYDGFERCVVFHSLSKRSSVPGLRSGFMAGDPRIMQRLRLYRTYHGCAMAVPTQLASIPAWQDEAYTAANRKRYQDKFAQVIPILSRVLPVERPAGGFYLWIQVPGDDERFARDLFARCNVTVLPGSYLARPQPAPSAERGAAARPGVNPGAGRVRISLVPELAQCVEAAQRIAHFIPGWP